MELTLTLDAKSAKPLQAQVFDPFFTTKSEGLGLGLAISRGIVEECGGTLSVVSGEGGTVFRMDLLRADAFVREAVQEVS